MDRTIFIADLDKFVACQQRVRQHIIDGKMRRDDVAAAIFNARERNLIETGKLMAHTRWEKLTTNERLDWINFASAAFRGAFE